MMGLHLDAAQQALTNTKKGKTTGHLKGALLHQVLPFG